MFACVSMMNLSNGHDALQPTEQATPDTLSLELYNNYDDNKTQKQKDQWQQELDASSTIT